MIIKFHERMSGYHYFVNDPLSHHSMNFEIDVISSSKLFDFDISGKIYVGELTTFPVECFGILRVDYFKYHRISYKLMFEFDTKSYTYFGVKENVSLTKPCSLIRTHTICDGTIIDETNVIVSKSVINFDFNDLPKFIKSFRLKRK